MAWTTRPFSNSTELYQYLNDHGIDPDFILFDSKNQKYVIFYEAAGGASSGGVTMYPPPSGDMVLSREARGTAADPWWVASGTDAIPAAPTNPGNINNTEHGNNREWRIGGGAEGFPNMFRKADIFIHGNWETTTVIVTGVDVNDQDVLLAQATTFHDMIVSNIDVQMIKKFVLTTAALHADTNLDVDITLY